MTDAAPAPGAQPAAAEAGQGQGASTNDLGLHPDLSNVPEGIRTQVEALLKEYDGNVTRKFQEAADYRKQWEPYQQLGVDQLDPDELSDLMAFREIASDPDSFREWYQQVGQELGMGEDDDGAEDDAPSGLDPKMLEDMLGRALDQRLGPLEQNFQQQAEQQAVQQATQMLTEQLEALKTEHGEFDTEAVCQLALAYDGPDALQSGFADYQRLVGGAEKSFMQKKLDAPHTPEQGGRPGTTAQPIKGFGEASQAAREMMRQAQGT